MSANKKLLITVIAAVAIIALIGGAAAITVAALGRGASYAFWSEAENITSTETSNTTALAKENNPSEKYIEYEYYVIEGGEWNPTALWTRKHPNRTVSDKDNIMRPQFFNNESEDVINPIAVDSDGSINIKAVVAKYTGNISTLNIPDTTTVYFGDDAYQADVVEIASLNRESSPGAAVVDKMIIGRNVKAIGYSRGENGIVIKSGMFGFYALKDITVVRNGTGSADGVGVPNANGYFTEFDKITAVGHFFEDSPNVERINALIYSNIGSVDEIPQKQPIGDLGSVFVGQTETPRDFMETGIGENHAIDEGFKLSVSAIAANAADGLVIYKDTLYTEPAENSSFTMSSDGVYTAVISGTVYTFARFGSSNKGDVLRDGETVGRYEYGVYMIVVTLYQTDADGQVITDDYGIEKAAAKYYY